MGRTTTSASAPPGRPRRRSHAQRSDESRARILDAAVWCVAEDGFARTNLARVAERAGLSVGAIQHQFGDKQAVLEAAVGFGFDDLLAEMSQLPGLTTGDVDERVHVLVRALWERFARPQARAALEILLQMRAEPGFLERALPYLSDVRTSIDEMWKGALHEARVSRKQRIRAQRLLFTTLNGLALEASLLPGMPDVADDLDTLTEGILRILHGEGE